jgi:hypothetical protein
MSATFARSSLRSTVSLRTRSPTLWVAPLVAAVLAAFGIVGADCRWLVALAAHGYPNSIPFATAPTSGWHNVPVLAEAIFYGLWRLLGDRGLVLAQVAASAGAFAALAFGLRREAREAGTVALVSLGVLVACLPAIVIARNGLFSFVLFPLLLVLLERDAREPSNRIWLSVPLIALWSNLHGGVLIGCVVLAAYVGVARRRQLLVLVGAAIGLCLTPALWHTPDYYLGVADNEAAHRGTELWAPLGTGTFDVLVVIVALALAAVGLRAMRAWELVTVFVLGAATVHSGRLGVYLVFVLAYPAARAAGWRVPARLPAVVIVSLALLVVIGLARKPSDAGSRTLARTAARSGEPVLAEGVLAEQVMLAAGRVWVADPIDAFRGSDQRLYLDWLEGRTAGAAAVARAGRVLVLRDTAAGRNAAADRRLVRIGSDRDAVLYRRR